MEDEPKDVRTPQDEPKKDEAKFTREDLAKLVSEQAHKRQLNRMLNGTRNLMRQLRKASETTLDKRFIEIERREWLGSTKLKDG